MPDYCYLNLRKFDCAHSLLVTFPLIGEPCIWAVCCLVDLFLGDTKFFYGCGNKLVFLEHFC